MLIKICGNTIPSNLSEVEQLQPDLVGLIYYDKSKRFVGNQLDAYPFQVNPVGVFVNESFERVLEIAERLNIKKIQLHGQESVDYCQQLKEKGYEVFKAFGIHSSFNFQGLSKYDEVCDYFLFDTKTVLHGGSGKVFDWLLLNNYGGETPFLLCGGVGLENIKSALTIKHPRLTGFDLNSRLESEPGIKDINKTKQIIEIIRNH